MIRVTIELLPHGIESKKCHLGTMTIANDGSGDIENGNYHVALSKWGRPNESWKQGIVKNFPRRRLGPYDLIYQALRNIIGNRNKLREEAQ